MTLLYSTTDSYDKNSRTTRIKIANSKIISTCCHLLQANLGFKFHTSNSQKISFLCSFQCKAKINATVCNYANGKPLFVIYIFFRFFKKTNFTRHLKNEQKVWISIAEKNTFFNEDGKIELLLIKQLNLTSPVQFSACLKV